MLQKWVLLLVILKIEANRAPLPPLLGRSGSSEGGVEHVEGERSSSQKGKQGAMGEEGGSPPVPAPATAATAPRSIPVTVSPELVVSPPITTTVAPIVVSVTHPPLWLGPNSQNSA